MCVGAAADPFGILALPSNCHTVEDIAATCQPAVAETYRVYITLKQQHAYQLVYSSIPEACVVGQSPGTAKQDLYRTAKSQPSEVLKAVQQLQEGWNANHDWHNLLAQLACKFGGTLLQHHLDSLNIAKSFMHKNNWRFLHMVMNGFWSTHQDIAQQVRCNINKCDAAWKH